MSSNVYLNATVVSHVGRSHEAKEEHFFINGRYRQDYDNGNVQITMEQRGENFVYGVCDGNVGTRSKTSPSASMVSALKRYYEEVLQTSGDIESKMDLLLNCVEETNNVVYSKNLSSEDKIGSFDFGGVVISEGKFSAVNIGNCGVYLFREGTVKHITNEFERVNKLVKMGIITNDQAKRLSGKNHKLTFGVNKIDTHISESVKLKEGDVFLLCSHSLVKSIDEDAIKQILESNKDSEKAANAFVKQARQNFVKDNITVLVVTIDTVKHNINSVSSGLDEIDAKSRYNRTEKKDLVVRTAAILFALSVLTLFAAGIFYWNEIRGRGLVVVNSDPDTLAVNKDVSTKTQTPKKTITSTVVKKETDKNNEVQKASQTDVQKPIVQGPSEIVEYKLVEGDTLEQVAKKFYGDTQKYKFIMEKNNLENESGLQIGQTIKIYPVE